MLAPQAYRVRNERLIAFGRAGFAILALVAIYIDPLQPALYAEFGYGVLGFYLLWAIITAWFARRSIRLAPSRQIAIHVFDVATISILMVLTEAHTSPFFIFFTFVLLTATLRWSWRGLIITAIAVLFIFIGIGIIFGGGTEPVYLLIRSGCLTILSAMLGLMAASTSQLRREFARLSGPRSSTSSALPVPELLDYIAGVFGARRAFLVWSDPEEPWIYIGTRDESGTRVMREAPETLPRTVAPALEPHAFLVWNIADPEAILALAPPDRFFSWTGEALDPRLRSRFSSGAVLSAPLPSEQVSGRLFVLDPPEPSSDQILVAQVVAQQVASRFDLHRLMEQLQIVSANEERVRLARDLHDGIMQFLAGTGLQLEDIRRLLDRDPETAQQRLALLQQALTTEQRVLRGFIDDLRPNHSSSPEAAIDLAACLATLLPRLEQQWTLAITWSAHPPDVQLPGRLVQHLRYLVSEAAANARRHGHASRLDIIAEVSSDWLDLSLSDNGCGFPFDGRLEFEGLRDRNLGPVMLRERVRALGGRMALTSSCEGARIEISLPLRLEGRWR